MSNNLLELLKERLSGDVVSNLATLIGESAKNTESALHTALPSLLAALANKGSDSTSLGKLFNLLNSGNYDGGILSNLGALSRGGEETTKLVSEGGNSLSSLFGDKIGGITDLIANASGISKNSSSSLLGFITPIALGLIGKTLKIGNINSASGLAGLLSDQSGFLKNFIPAGLNNLLAGEQIAKTSTTTASTTDHIISAFDKVANTLDSGYTAPNAVQKTATITETFDNIGDKIEDMAEETLSSAKNMAQGFGESASQFGSHIVDEGKGFAHSAADAFEEGAGEGRKFLPWILLAAALALAWGLLKSCSVPDTAPDTTVSSTTTPAVTEPPTTTPPPAGQVAALPVQPVPTTPEPAKAEVPVVDNASDFFEKTLSTGYAIKAAKDGFESKLVGFIEGNEAINKDLWFNMDGIIFDTNKASVKAESNTQINHIAEILKAYPNVKIKIGGYTDNTGKANANKKLSNNRANAVKKALVTQGIKADRLDAEGYGSEHPVASNHTAEGRQQNRRIDVRVTEK
jgi:OmpA-OmpF porin, OOP family